MQIRPETSADHAAVRQVHAAAFETDAEARLVDGLRASGVDLVSWVADGGGEIIGHILFSPVSSAGHPEARVAGLAPMAVLPARQRSGVGSALVEAGLEACRAAGFTGAVVLGHPDYYPRFGFVPAARFGIDSEYPVPEEVFMARPLTPGGLDGLPGRVRYHPAFASL